MSRLSVKRLADEEACAAEYADAINRQLREGPFSGIDWTAINADIIDRWSMSALRRVKERAWVIADERRRAVSRP